ncbi:ABC transporter ATP-binding protein [Micromonospora sp. NBC_01796]|uniref:ABC transporter ATP-binding protein n=1 Tax=Micromonospora sp. NBC_01796 TaxID=2975987 RepID=UPI002DD7C3BB|nr:ATP-binding cassette domain-containing protein [Micromonospora sp. NBC_01796]WSA84723.1 ATP-binding cassette domain-containing protein [Micromonospora sp. NBC_01796]
MTEHGLALHGIGVRFGGLTALDDVSLRVPADRVVGVIGPNGAGKTTLFNVVCGLVQPSTGTLTLDGRPLRPRPHRLTRLGIARTLQGVGLFAGLTVLENVMAGATNSARAGFAAALFGLPRSDRDERRLREHALTILEGLGVADRAGAAPGTLPFAVRKRVALARALAARPRLLLLDEPAGGLGAEDIDELGALIRDLPRRTDHPCAVLLVEHHMDLVMAVCDEIVVLDFGRVIAAGPPNVIRDDPAVTEAYLGAEVDQTTDAAATDATATADAGVEAEKGAVA